MRKIYPLLFAISLTISNGQAQTIGKAAQPRWGIGALAGINHSTPVLGNSSYSSFRPQLSPLFALDVIYRFNQWSSLHVQPGWTSLNYQPDQTAYQGLGYQNLSVSTIKIPLLYRYRFSGDQQTPSGNRLTPFVEVGTAYNRAVHGAYTVSPPCDFCVPLPTATNDYSTRYSLATKSALSLVGSVGVSISMKNSSIPVLVRYERYLTSQTFATDYNPDGTSIRFGNIGLMTGINF